MSNTLDRLVIAISSRALFDLSESHHIFMEHGTQAYHQYQIEHENEILKPGVAFALTKKLLALNSTDRKHVEVILLSRNSAETGLRVFNSISHYNLDIARAAFTRGAPTSRYVAAFGAHLFLSADAEDVKRVLEDGYAAATIFPGAGQSASGSDDQQLRIAFDGDAVLFSDESERIYQQQGLNAFAAHEQSNAHTTLPGGPFKNFLAALHHIQSSYPENELPIRTALVTARAAPAHERVVHTLREWNIRIDEAFFLGGLNKTEFLRMFGADIFFDDQLTHCEAAAPHMATGHVPHGVVNERLPEPVQTTFVPSQHATQPHPVTPVTPVQEVQEIEPVSTPSQVTQPMPEHSLANTQQHPVEEIELKLEEPEVHFEPLQAASSISSTNLNTLEDDPLLMPTRLDESFSPQTSHNEVHLNDLHLEITPIVDGTPPMPSSTLSQHAEQVNQDNVWLFDEDNPHKVNTPSPQPLPLPTTSTHTAQPSQQPVKEETLAATEPETVLSTEEILRRFARKMTEGTTQTSKPASSNPPSTSAVPQPQQPAHTPATAQQPAPAEPQTMHSNNDIFQNMSIEEIAYEPVKPASFDAFADDPLMPAQTTAQPAHMPSGDKKTNPQHSDTSPRPSVPNPFALMKDFEE